MKIIYSIFLVVTLLMFFGCADKHIRPTQMNNHQPVPLSGMPSEPPPTEQEYEKAVKTWVSQYAEDCTRELGEKVTCSVQSISKPTYSPDRAWCVMVVIRIERMEHGNDVIATKSYRQETIAMTIEKGKAQPYSSNLPKCN
jgi:hypothetical protein